MNIAYNMDCLDGMRKLEDCCVDLTVTSPPYDNLRDYNGYSFNPEATIGEIFRVMKNGGVVVWIVNDATVNGSKTGTSFKQALCFMNNGFNLHDTMIWEKPTFTATGSLAVRYAPVFEYMFIFSKGKPKTFNPIKDKPNKYAGKKNHGTVRQKDGSVKSISGIGKPIAQYGQRHNVWHIAPEQSQNKRCHPAQFPEQLARDHIISWSNEGDTVLDPFLGSGTTRIAAYDLNRDFIGYEVSKEYFDKQEERFAQHTAQLSLFVNDSIEVSE